MEQLYSAIVRRLAFNIIINAEFLIENSKKTPASYKIPRNNSKNYSDPLSTMIFVCQSSCDWKLNSVIKINVAILAAKVIDMYAVSENEVRNFKEQVNSWISNPGFNIRILIDFHKYWTTKNTLLSMTNLIEKFS